MTKTYCDNCCRNGESVQDAIAILPSGRRNWIGSETPACDSCTFLEQEALPSSKRLPISEALSSICCTLWGDPVSAEIEPEMEHLTLCPTCTEALTQLYNALSHFRHLCHEQGKVFGRLLELRKLRRKQEIVVSVVKLERLPKSSTEQRSLRQRQRRPTPSDGAETSITENRLSPRISERNVEVVDEFDVEIKEEEPCSDDDPQEQLDDNFDPDNGQDYFSSSDDCISDSDSDCEFVIRPQKKSASPKKTPLKGSSTGPFDCENCGKSFYDSKGRIRHIKEKHSNTFSKIPCPVEGCTRAYSRKEQVKKHVREQHPNDVASLASLERVKVQKEIRQRQTRRIPCHECGVLVIAGKIKQHLTKHSDERPHLCDLCGKAFKVMRHLQNHVSQTHKKEKVFTCPYPDCNVTTTRNATLTHHIDEIHQKAAAGFTFICDQCGKQFVHERSMKVHQKMHDQDGKGLTCEICQKMFSRSENLRQHMKSVHEGIKTVKKGEKGPSRNSVAKVVSRKDAGQGCHNGFQQPDHVDVEFDMEFPLQNQ